MASNDEQQPVDKPVTSITGAPEIADEIYSGKRPWNGGNVLAQALLEARKR